MDRTSIPIHELEEALKKPLEYEFLLQIRDAGLPEPVREFMFAKEALGRKWRSDFAWPDIKLIVEIEGGIFKRGRHQTPMGFHGDTIKYNAATELGYRVFRYTPISVDDKSAIKQIERIFKEENG